MEREEARDDLCGRSPVWINTSLERGEEEGV